MREFLEPVVWGNTVGGWLTAAGVAVVVYAILWLVVRVGLRRLAALSTRTRTEIDDLVTEVLGKTRTMILLLVAAYAGSLSLSLPLRFQSGLRHVAFIAATILMFLHPTGALTIFVLGLATAFVAALVERGFKHRERTAIRQALERHECPQCGAGVTATGGEWSCARCGA